MESKQRLIDLRNTDTISGFFIVGGANETLFSICLDGSADPADIPAGLHRQPRTKIDWHKTQPLGIFWRNDNRPTGFEFTLPPHWAV